MDYSNFFILFVLMHECLKNILRKLKITKKDKQKEIQIKLK